jgi:hypothetical protein
MPAVLLHAATISHTSRHSHTIYAQSIPAAPRSAPPIGAADASHLLRRHLHRLRGGAQHAPPSHSDCPLPRTRHLHQGWGGEWRGRRETRRHLRPDLPPRDPAHQPAAPAYSGAARGARSAGPCLRFCPCTRLQDGLRLRLRSLAAQPAHRKPY